MTTARAIISSTLTFGLNVLSPGEALDADVAAACLTALNDVADEINGTKALLWREKLTQSSPITGTSGTLGVDWVGVNPGDRILSATVAYSATLDVPMEPITMGQYASIAIKSVTTYPAYYAADGYATVYLYPAATAHRITLRTAEQVTTFADLDTDYQMPSGAKSTFSALLAEKMARALTGKIDPFVVAQAKAARNRFGAQVISPEIIGGGAPAGPVARIRRGY